VSDEEHLSRKQTEEIEESIASQRRIVEDLEAKGEDTAAAKNFLEVLIQCRNLRRPKATSRVPRKAPTTD
jgi:hypothetical protein